MLLTQFSHWYDLGLPISMADYHYSTCYHPQFAGAPGHTSQAVKEMTIMGLLEQNTLGNIQDAGKAQLLELTLLELRVDTKAILEYFSESAWAIKGLGLRKRAQPMKRPLALTLAYLHT